MRILVPAMIVLLFLSGCLADSESYGESVVQADSKGAEVTYDPYDIHESYDLTDDGVEEAWDVIIGPGVTEGYFRLTFTNQGADAPIDQANYCVKIRWEEVYENDQASGNNRKCQGSSGGVSVSVSPANPPPSYSADFGTHDSIIRGVYKFEIDVEQTALTNAHVDLVVSYD